METFFIVLGILFFVAVVWCMYEMKHPYHVDKDDENF